MIPEPLSPSADVCAIHTHTFTRALQSHSFAPCLSNLSWAEGIPDQLFLFHNCPIHKGSDMRRAITGHGSQPGCTAQEFVS